MTARTESRDPGHNRSGELCSLCYPAFPAQRRNKKRGEEVEVQTGAADVYLESLSPARKVAMEKLREVVRTNLPDGFEEHFSYGMIGFVVPLSIYPAGYHARKNEPLPFISLASQKNHIALYHMGMYGNPALTKWFREEYSTETSALPDMAKSCIRFRHPDRIPFDLIAKLCGKMSVQEYIVQYELSRKR